MTDWPTLTLTGALVLITGYYARQNWRMAEAMHRQNELSTQPFVVASLVELPPDPALPAWPGGRLTIRNIGVGPALFIRLNSVVLQRQKTPEEEHIVRFLPDIDILAAGETVTLTCRLEVNGQVTPTDWGNMFWHYVFRIQTYDVAIRYDGAGGQRYRTPMRFGKEGARLLSLPVKETVLT